MNIFAHIGGVPVRLWFGNLSPVVKKILKNDGRELTEAFLRFKNHYGFTAAFCNAGSSHEKGHVEKQSRLPPVLSFLRGLCIGVFKRQRRLRCTFFQKYHPSPFWG